MRDFLDYLPPRLDEYDRMVMRNRIFKRPHPGRRLHHPRRRRSTGGRPGPMLRATRAGVGLAQEAAVRRLRAVRVRGAHRRRTATCYDRAVVHVEEMRQSLRIIEQCLSNMPAGPYKSTHPLATPPLKERTMHDIETLIHHFLGVSWGPVDPAGEAFVRIEAAKGAYSYYLVSDGTPPVPHPHPHRLLPAPADGPADGARADDPGPGRDAGRASTSCWRTWTGRRQEDGC